MKDFHIYLSNAREFILKYKILFLVIFALILAIALPGAISFAIDEPLEATEAPAIEESTEATDPAAPLPEAEEALMDVPEETAATNEDATKNKIASNSTITGTIKDSDGNAIPESKEPYIMVACLRISLLEPVYQKRIYLKGGATEFSIDDVPSDMIKGVITAGAKGFANEILILPGSGLDQPKNFVMKAGSDCTFQNEEDKLKEYKLCQGSTIVTAEGDSFTLDTDIGLGAGLPVFGLPVGSTFTETVDPYTYEYSLTYNYENSSNGEKMHLIFEVSPESAYSFNYCLINDELIPSDGFTITAGQNITIKPVFSQRGKMIVGGIVKDKATGKAIKDAYGYIIGINISTGEMYYSKMKKTDNEGIFTFENVPDGLKGVIVGGAPGYTTQPQYLSYYVPRTEFNLNPGVVCTIEAPEELSTVMIEAGSKIKIDGFDEIVLPFPVDLGNEFPPLGFPNDGKMYFNENGVVEYKFTHDDPDHSVKSLDLLIKAYPKSGFGFKNWLLNGEEYSGELDLSTIKDDFTVTPVFRQSGPVSYSASVLQSERTQHPLQPIEGAYAYLIGFHYGTSQTYLSDVVTTDAKGVFTIPNVPDDVRGVIVVGATGFTNRFQYVDFETPATDFHLDVGVICYLDMPEGASNVLLQKGSSVTVKVENVPIEIPLTEDVDFGNMFLPFGMTPHGTFTFNDDGGLNFTYENNDVAFVKLNLNLKVLPKDGYAFACWLKNGEQVTGQYVMQEGDTDFVLTPYFVATDIPVIPTGLAQTFDSTDDFLIAFLILVSAFGVVFITRRFVLKR